MLLEGKNSLEDQDVKVAELLVRNPLINFFKEPSSQSAAAPEGTKGLKVEKAPKVTEVPFFFLSSKFL